MLLQVAKTSVNQPDPLAVLGKSLATCLDGLFILINADHNPVRPAQFKDPGRQAALPDRTIEVASSRPAGQTGKDFMCEHRDMEDIGESIGISSSSHFLPLNCAEYTTKDGFVNKNIAFLRR